MRPASERFDTNKPYVVGWTDDAILTDMEGTEHVIFQQDRRAVTLTIPKWVELSSAVESAGGTGGELSEIAQQLIDVVAEAMEDTR